MPYIEEGRREAIRIGDEPRNEGELNYLISLTVHRYIAARKINYATFNEVIGVLNCVLMELYRQVAAPYEDYKRMLNGSVSALDSGEKNPHTYMNWLNKLLQRDSRTMRHEPFQRNPDLDTKGVTPIGERQAMAAAPDIVRIAELTQGDEDTDLPAEFIQPAPQVEVRRCSSTSELNTPVIVMPKTPAARGDEAVDLVADVPIERLRRVIAGSYPSYWTQVVCKIDGMPREGLYSADADTGIATWWRADGDGPFDQYQGHITFELCRADRPENPSFQETMRG
jgi:hypothetical protein